MCSKTPAKMMFMGKFLWVGAILWICGCGESNATAPSVKVFGPFGIGVRSIELVDASRQDRPLPTLVYYPSTVEIPEGDHSSMMPFQMSQYSVLDAEIDSSAAPYPLILFSHGSGAQKEFHKYFLEYLASHGFVCAVMNHTGNVGATNSEPEIHMTITRLFDVEFVLGELLKRFETPGDFFHQMGDPERIGLGGHSYGGHIMLAIAGAKYDYEHIFELCVEPEKAEDPYICPLLEAKTEIENHLPDTRIKAVISLAHDSSRFYFGAESQGVASLQKPTLFAAGTEDSYGDLYNLDAKSCYEKHPGPTYLLKLIGGGHLGFTDVLNEGSMKLERMQEIVQQLAVAFYGYHLKGIEEYGQILTQAPADWMEKSDDLQWSFKFWL